MKTVILAGGFGTRISEESQLSRTAIFLGDIFRRSVGCVSKGRCNK